MPDTVQVYDRTFPSFSWPAIHPRISQILSGSPRGKLLDMPAGSGALSYRLWKEGFDVTACDIEPRNFQPREVPCVAGDLRLRFPFEDGTFDFACFVEGPEHAENPLHAFREFARVLRPGGKLVVTLPNYDNIENRLRILFFGTAEKAVSQERFRAQFRGETAMLHLSPLLFAQLRFFLEVSGFEIAAIEKDRFKPKQMLLFPLVLAIQALSALAGRRGREHYFLDQVNSRKVILGGNTLILVAAKTAGG